MIHVQVICYPYAVANRFGIQLIGECFPGVLAFHEDHIKFFAYPNKTNSYSFKYPSSRDVLSQGLLLWSDRSYLFVFKDRNDLVRVRDKIVEKSKHFGVGANSQRKAATFATSQQSRQSEVAKPHKQLPKKLNAQVVWYPDGKVGSGRIFPIGSGVSGVLSFLENEIAFYKNCDFMGNFGYQDVPRRISFEHSAANVALANGVSLWNQGVWHFVFSQVDELRDAHAIIQHKVRPTCESNDASTQQKGQRLELACKRRLEDLGFDAHLTKASGDFGVDIVAHKHGVRIAIQCKNWATKAGTSAISEVVAGCAYYRCTYAVVVAPAGFTQAAVELAHCNHVLLCSPKDISSWRLDV